MSKLRGKEAVAELRKKKQAQLDKQKKVLDRKLQARYIFKIFIAHYKLHHNIFFINKSYFI